MSVPFLACMLAVAQFNHLPPKVLASIQHIEGGSVGNVSPNSNGTEDLGLMQVNTIWIAPVARQTRQSEAAVRARLINDGCFNVAVAGAILRQYRAEAKGDLVVAIGYYHSHTNALAKGYQLQVREAQGRMIVNPPAR